ncbi:MAG: tetratricopeptide repeat protein [Pyrinomonadaceae bacterium]
MKRCPECRRDYYDDSLSYCLADGTTLVHGLSDDEAATAILHEPLSERTQKPKNIGLRRAWLIAAPIALLSAVVVVYALFFRASPTFSGSFRDVSSPAYEYYLRGKLDAHSENRDRNEKAIKILQDVVAADPSFAPAYAELARAYSIQANYHAADAEKKKIYEDARLAVEKALALDQNLAEGHFVRAAVMWTHVESFPHEQAIQSLKRAIALEPNLPGAHHQLGVIYFHIGMLDKGQTEFEKTLSINPTDAMARFRIGLIHSHRAEYERALAIFKTVPREVNPQVFDRSLATVLFQLGRTEEASKIVDDFLAKSSDEGGNVTSVKAMLLAKAGKEREAEESIKRAIEIGQSFQHFHHTTYNIASAYALLGKPEEALKWLEFTADDGFPCYLLFENDANLNSLRKDQRFINFMTKMKQQWEHYQASL